MKWRLTRRWSGAFNSGAPLAVARPLSFVVSSHRGTRLISPTIAAVISAVAAAISSACAVRTYGLTRKTQAEAEAEERLHAGQPMHPRLNVHEHSQAVIYCAVFNKSTKKKAVVTSVKVF